MQKETMRPAGRIITYMPFCSKRFGRILGERLVSLDAKFYFLCALGFLPACAKVLQSPAKRHKLYQKSPFSDERGFYIQISFAAQGQMMQTCPFHHSRIFLFFPPLIFPPSQKAGNLGDILITYLYLQL